MPHSRPNSEHRGTAVLADPLLNKGTAFSPSERARLNLDGLLPPAVETLKAQVARAYEAYLNYAKPLNQHIYLRQLQDTNEVLFYRLVTEHLEEVLPVVYTPTVGDACRQFSSIYRRPRGLFLSWEDRHRFREILRNRPHDDQDVDVIVVTDGQRILGLGDLGVGGMGIPIGKLSLYTAIGGIAPARTLPILLDVGTDNDELLADPRYLGRRSRRLTGAEYDEMIESFVSAVEAELPNTLLQWEDFATAHARPILTRYRDRLLTFNDDIQGTAAVALGDALSTAADISGTPLAQQRLVVLGAGSAAIGVADMIRTAMTEEGVSVAAATARFWVVDVDGLLVRSRTGLTDEQRLYARDDDEVAEWNDTGLAEVVRRTAPTALIGLSTARGAFTEAIVRQMASTCERPVIFPLSNPTSNAEADPADLHRWTNGTALIATGSPFAPLKVDGHEVTVAQANNVYVFPAIGLAVTASRAARVTDHMLVAAARAIARCATEVQDGDGPARLLPPLSGMRAAARDIALAAALAAVEDGVAPKATEKQLRKAIASAQWKPDYGDTAASE